MSKDCRCVPRDFAPFIFELGNPSCPKEHEREERGMEDEMVPGGEKKH